MERENDTPSFSTGRRLGVGVNVALMAFIVLTIVVMANYLAARHFKRVNLSAQSAQALSPETLGVLRNITNKVRIVALFDGEEPLFRHVRSMLREYQQANPNLVIEHVDYLRDPGAGQLLKSQYNLSHVTDKDLVLFDCDKKVKIVYDREMSDYDYSGLMAGKTNEVKRIAFKGESLFTAAIVSVTDPRAIKAYFLGGHGEHDPGEKENELGYAKFLNVLAEKNIQAEPLALLGTNDVPSDCQLLIVAGPRTRIDTLELDKLEKYLAAGGRMLVLLNSLAPNTGIERVLANWGVVVGNNLVFDPENTLTRQDIIASRFGNHPAVRPLAGLRVHMVMPHSVEQAARTAGTADAAKVDELIFSGPESFAVTDIRNGVPYQNPADRKGPLALAVAVEKGGLEGVRGATRIVVVGESRFLGNQLIDSAANRDFVSLAANWMLDRTALMGGVGPRALQEYRLALTVEQVRQLRWILFLIIPGVVLLLGLLVWLRRRR